VLTFIYYLKNRTADESSGDSKATENENSSLKGLSEEEVSKKNIHYQFRNKIKFNFSKFFLKRLKLRAKKFGVQAEESKKDQRAQRFGISNSAKSEKDDSKALEKRAQRFGTEPNTPVKPDSELLDKRAKRFGIDNSSPNKVGFEKTPFFLTVYGCLFLNLYQRNLMKRLPNEKRDSANQTKKM
jgi:hypothetical protein